MAPWLRRSGSLYVWVGLLAFAFSAGLLTFSFVVGHSGSPAGMLRVAAGGQAGFDGQYFLRLAEDPLVGPAAAGALDAPMLRARRIGLPVAGWMLAPIAGSPAAGLLLAEIALLALLIAVVQQGARAWELSPFAVLAVPLSLPFALSLELVTAEVGVAAFVLLAANAARLRALPVMIGSLAAACLFKEVGVLAVLAFSCASFLQGRKREGLLTLTALLPFAGWHAVLSVRLGEGAGLSGLLTNVSVPGAGLSREMVAQLSALHSGPAELKAAGVLAALLWYVAGSVLALLLLRGGPTPGRLLSLAGALLVLTLSSGGSAQAYNEIFNFGRQLFLLPVGLLAVLFGETSSLSGRLRGALLTWFVAGSLLGLGWLLQESLLQSFGSAFGL